jgi:hypothetical protein
VTIKQQRKKQYNNNNNKKPGKANMKKTHEFSVESELAVKDFYLSLHLRLSVIRSLLCRWLL